MRNPLGENNVRLEPLDKYFISADSLLRDSIELGLQVVRSGFRPTFLVGIWRGGAPIANCPKKRILPSGRSLTNIVRQGPDGSAITSSVRRSDLALATLLC
jgi:hypothetical protein